MGLKVSFLLFSGYLWALLRERFPPRSFCITGDDIVCPFEGLNYFAGLGFAISYRKSYWSTPYMEFCGCPIDIHGPLHVTRLKKISKPLSLMSRFGRHVLRLKGYWKHRKWLLFIANFPPPIGLGWKPKSVNMLTDLLAFELYRKRPEQIPLIPSNLSPAMDYKIIFQPPLIVEAGPESYADSKVRIQGDDRRYSCNCVIDHFNHMANDDVPLTSVTWTRICQIYGVTDIMSSPLEYPTLHVPDQDIAPLPSLNQLLRGSPMSILTDDRKRSALLRLHL